MFFGGNDFSSVYASQTTSDNFGYGELEIAAQCHFVMKSGLMASASLDFLRPEGAETHGDDRIRIAGTHGVIEIFNGNIIVTDSEKQNIIDSPASDREIFSDFVFDVLGERKALVDAEQTFLLTNICLQARQSADTGQIIHL
jgi:predicted dehydrogenase